jgi:hypothetical protein
MFIDPVSEKTFLAPEERNVLFGYQMFRSGARKLIWVVAFYKHLVPLGPKTRARPKIPTSLLHERER